jgi:hypothetical protein
LSAPTTPESKASPAEPVPAPSKRYLQ